MTSRMMVKCCIGLLLLLTLVPITSVAEAYWSPPLKIDEGDHARYPGVFVEPNGNAIVQWWEDPELIEDPNVLRAMQYDVDTGWGSFELLERSDVNPNSSFTFVQDLDGNIIAAWREYDGSRWWIHTSRIVAGGSWSDPETIDTGDRGDSDMVRITMNPAGNAIMMWRQTISKKIYIYARMYVSGTGWQESIRVLEGISSWYGERINANGHAIFLYENDDTNGYYAKRYVPATGWGAAEQIDMGTGTAYSPRVEMDPGGNAMAVWSENDGVQWKIYARRFEAGTGWGTPQEIGYKQGTPLIKIDSIGNLLAIWNYNQKIYANRYEVGVGWGMPQEIGDGDVDALEIAMDSSGNLILVWKDKVGDDCVLYTNIYKVGVGWGTSELMWTAFCGYGGFGIQSFEINPHGEAVLLWLMWAYPDDIYANYYSPETGWDTPEWIGSELDSGEDDPHGPLFTPRAVIDERGNVIAIWRYYDRNLDTDNPIEIIYSKQYKPGEGWQAAEARVTYNPGYRLGRYDIAEKPVISMNPIGDAFLVWIRFGMVMGEEHMYSINAARYVAEVPPACKGDFDSNGEMDEADLAVFAADFGRSDCGSGAACEGDFEPDNNVDGKDLATFVADFGRTDCP